MEVFKIGSLILGMFLAATLVVTLIVMSCVYLESNFGTAYGFIPIIIMVVGFAYFLGWLASN